MGHMLRFSGRPRLYRINSDAAPFENEIEGVLVYEDVSPTPNVKEHEVEYRIVAEAEVSTGDEARRVRSVVFVVARDLDRLWTYVAGTPLNIPSRTIRQLHAPRHWDGNFLEVDEKLQREGAMGNTARLETQTSQRWYELPIFPLKQVLEIRERFHQADERLQHLVDLFFEAERMTDGHAQLFLLAKCVELVHFALVEGELDDKEKHLPSDTVEAIDMSFRELWTLQNTKRDLRHPADKRGDLRDTLTPSERRAYRATAELIVRDVVADRLDGNFVRKV